MKHFKLNKYTDIAAMILLLVILLFMILGGCSLFQNIEDESVNEHDENLIVVGVSQLGSESGWRTANTESVQTAFTKKNGYFLLFNNARQKQENQFKTIRSFISRRVDYIVFAPVVETGWETVLSEAKEAGIPVILMDRSVTIEDKSLYTALVGSNFVEEGEKAGRWLEKDLEEKGRSEKDINIVISVSYTHLTLPTKA